MDRTLQEWISSASLTEKEIADYAANVLNNPSLTLKGDSGAVYYSYTQMLAMFMHGRESRKKRRLGKPEEPNAYKQIRAMEKGDTITLPVNKWGAARVSASKLKQMYGVLYKVKKVSDLTRCEIEITRLQ